MKIGIIGGGASGLMLASMLNNYYMQADIEIFERLEHVGKKLLLTGNGKCNLSNARITPDCYNNDFAYNVASCFDARNYFASIGLITYIGEQGRIYPFSNTSNSVLDILRKNIKNVTIHEQTQVNRIIKKDDNTYDLITTNGNFNEDIVVVATGGKTYYKDSNSYVLANMLSHQVTSLIPSLCPIKVDDNLSSIENLRCKINATLYNESGMIYKDKGEALFKKDYISGIIMFQLSSKIAQNPLDKYYMSLDFAPSLSYDNLVEYLKNNDDLIGLFPKMIGQFILKKANSTNPEIIASTIKDLRFNIIQNIDFKQAQVTSGGVNVNELTENLESKINKNLYFAGEIVDADGICGGYNLQFAFASAYKIFNDIKNKIEANNNE